MSLERTFKKIGKQLKSFKPNRVKDFVNGWVNQFKRVMRRSKKPGKEEYLEVVKITGIGLLIIGFIGFIIQTIFLKVLKL